MNKKPLFSICMPVYNGETYIGDAINSVINQEFTSWELVIVDDGSTDDTWKICKLFSEKDNRIRVFRKNNQGALAARQYAIQFTKGDYILFIDADDYYEKYALRKLYETVEACEVDIILFGYNEVDGSTIQTYKNHFQPGYIEKQIILSTVISGPKINSMCTKAIRAKLMKGDKTDYSEFYSTCFGEDKIQFFYPLTYATSFVYIDCGLYNYRINNQSISHKRYSKAIIEKRCQMQVWKLLRSYMTLWSRDSKDDIEQYAAYCLRNLINIYSTSCNIEGGKELVKSIDWIKYIPEEVFGNKCSCYFERKNRIKLWCIKHKITNVFTLNSFVQKVLRKIKRG